MNHLNSVLIEGCLAEDPLFRTLDDGPDKGKDLCQFTIASNRFFKGDNGLEKEVTPVLVEAWGKLAEACSCQGKKGRDIRAVGRLKENYWSDHEGNQFSRIVIVVEHIEFRPEFKKGKEAEE